MKQKGNPQTQTITRSAITEWMQSLQDDICRQLEAADGQIFREDLWERPEGGGGRTRVLEGHHIEKGGVNFSAVHGPLSVQAAKGLGVAPGEFYATGVSIVLHPRNPHVPIIHMNVRYFETASGSEKQWWFGGGIDLTPHYVNPEDARYFHRQIKTVCDRHDPEYYPKFKAWADDYFFLPHRQETRGIGGIFFDRLCDRPINDLWTFVQDVGNIFAPTYIHFLNAHKNQPFTEAEQQWQALRRGRYVEFNLVWDRGTKFGLDTGGRTESILMSMPPHADWKYDHQPEAGSREAATLNWLRKGIDWV